MNYNYRYRLRPSDALEQQLAWTVDTCKQVYNHFLHRLNRTDGTSAYSEQKLLHVETALPVSSVVDAKRVVETGSPTLKREGVSPSGRVG